MIQNIFPQKSVFSERNSFITIMQLINPNYCILENLGSNRLTLLKTNCFKGVSFLDFYYHLPYSWVNLICLTIIFLKSPWWPVWTFHAQNFPRGRSHTQDTNKKKKKNTHWTFSQEHIHPLIETSCHGSCN